MGMKYKDPVTGQLKELSLKAADTLPIGTVVDYDGDTVPDGWEQIDDDDYEIITSGDFNNLMGTNQKVPKRYLIQADNLNNRPNNNWGWLTSYYMGDGGMAQVFVADNKGIFVRNYSGGKWGPWRSATDDYSTDEICIGTWINGKPIYRKVIFTKTGTTKTETVVGEVPSSRETIVNLTAAVVNSETSIIPIPFYFNTENYGGIWIDYNTRKIHCLITNNAYANKDLTIYIEYTKGTD